MQEFLNKTFYLKAVARLINLNIFYLTHPEILSLIQDKHHEPYL
jgi:hypothetical protein